MNTNKPALIALGVFIVFALAILSVVPPPQRVVAPADTTAPLVFGIFRGITPCADCAGIDTRLTLMHADEWTAEGTYELSLTYVGEDVEPYVQTGVWTTERGTPADPDATVYAIDPDQPERTTRYLKTSDTTIRQLNRDGTEIDPSMPFTLTLVPGS